MKADMIIKNAKIFTSEIHPYPQNSKNSWVLSEIRSKAQKFLDALSVPCVTES